MSSQHDLAGKHSWKLAGVFKVKLSAEDLLSSVSPSER
jgi:hypothetical protein